MQDLTKFKGGDRLYINLSNTNIQVRPGKTTLAVAPAQHVFAPMGSIIGPDSFTIGLAFDWKPPHGQWMNQMLKDIGKARKAGDTQTH